MNETVRPTKKQRDILTYIERFIGEHGYSPSYREIMNGLDYTSVATVSLHVNSLIRRGHLRKRDRSARSLEVVNPAGTEANQTDTIEPGQEKWLIDKIEKKFAAAEKAGKSKTTAVNVQDLNILVSTLKILGMTAPATIFSNRLAALQPEETDMGVESAERTQEEQ